jgi:hypothetical protein
MKDLMSTPTLSGKREAVEAEVWRVLSEYSQAPLVHHVAGICDAVESYVALAMALVQDDRARERQLARVSGADARRHTEAAVRRQLAIVWAAGVTAGQQPPDTTDATALAARAATRQKIIDDAARAIDDAGRPACTG